MAVKKEREEGQEERELVDDPNYSSDEEDRLGKMQKIFLHK